MRHVVVMGVAGCGKSSVAARAAQALGLAMIEGDAFHAPGSVAKMSAGQPLTDADRAGWLDRLAAELTAHPGGAVLACSALKRAYRDRLRAAVPALGFVFLELGRDAALVRVRARPGHFFSAVLVDDQFATLQPPTGEAGVLVLDATAAPDDIDAAVQAWAAGG